MTTDAKVIVRCPKCGFNSGDDWSQCEGDCPMPMSPHYRKHEPGERGYIFPPVIISKQPGFMETYRGV